MSKILPAYLAVFALLCSAQTPSQVTAALYGHYYSGVYPNGVELVGRIDPDTGVVSPVATVGSGMVGTPFCSAFDPTNQNYLFYLSDQSGTHLYAVNVLSGAITSSSNTSWLPISMEFDRSSATLYGVVYVGPYPSGWVSLVQIDLATGNFIPVATVVTGAPGIGVASAFDSLTRRYFLYADDGSGMRLYTVSVRTGKVTSSAPVSTIPSSIEFDLLRRRLLGSLYLPSSNSQVIAEIDPTTGAANPIVTVGVGPIWTMTASAFDPLTGRYFSYAGSGPDMALYVANVVTGTVKISGPVTQAPSAIQFSSR